MIQGELDALAETAEDLSEDTGVPGGGARAAEPDAREPGPDRARLRAGDGDRGRAMSLVLEFAGWCWLLYIYWFGSSCGHRAGQLDVRSQPT